MAVTKIFKAFSLGSNPLTNLQYPTPLCQVFWWNLLSLSSQV